LHPLNYNADEEKAEGIAELIGKYLRYDKFYIQDVGGEYWRQLVFYKILVDNDPLIKKKVHTGEMHFIEPDEDDKFYRHKYVITEEDVRFVTRQIVMTKENIVAGNFEKGCGEEDCLWCSFKERYLQSGNPQDEILWELLSEREEERES